MKATEKYQFHVSQKPYGSNNECLVVNIESVAKQREMSMYTINHNKYATDIKKR